MKKICFDFSTIIPGKGGSGGGVATYAFALLQNLDSIVPGNIEFYCILNSQVTKQFHFKNIKIEYKVLEPSNLAARTIWMHYSLPRYCKKNGIHLLFRATPELPFYKVCKFSCMVHDFMADQYLTKSYLRKHLTYGEKFKFVFFRSFEKKAIKKADILFTPSNAIKEEMEARFAQKVSRIIVTHEACNILPRHEPESTFPAKFTFGVIAGFYPHKGHLKVIKFASKLKQLGFSNFEILFRGNPTYPTYIEDIKKEIGRYTLEDNITFIPFTKNVTIQEIYSSISVLLLLSEYEGFGLPLLEAQAMGKPVICTDLPVFREVLEQSALYVPENLSTDDIAQLIPMLKDYDLLKKLSLQGYENVKRFSWANTAKQTIDELIKI